MASTPSASSTTTVPVTNDPAIYSRAYIPTAKQTETIIGIASERPIKARAHAVAVAALAIWAAAIHTVMIPVSAAAFTVRSAVYLLSLGNKKDFLGHEASINAVLEHAVKAIKFTLTVPFAIALGLVLSPSAFGDLQKKFGLVEEKVVVVDPTFVEKVKEQLNNAKEHLIHNAAVYAGAVTVLAMARFCPYLAPSESNSGYVAQLKFWGSNLLTGGVVGTGVHFAQKKFHNHDEVVSVAAKA